MRVVVQRVLSASVASGEERTVHIGPGLVVLCGIAPDDDRAALGWMSRKMVNLRIFDDESGRMNRSVKDIGGEILLVSQFTLYGDVMSGNRPGFSGAAGFEIARPLFEQFHEMVQQEMERPVPTGWYGEHMQVTLVNDGPVTLIIDSPTHS
ncbi:MAG: D-tyrosyl-tRNA(Tyr) deacylase [Chlorobiaceae bacterium]|nr:D-tyrosyl-tRNA(Tyr) deacylase [Chlorobiaceae bacterium]